MATEPSEAEREQIEEDIERLQLALRADEDDKSDAEIDEDGDLRIDETADKDTDEPQPGPSHISDDSNQRFQDVQATAGRLGSSISIGDGNVVGIDELPVNAETSLALNRTYQELVLDLLRKIEIALADNREKQRLLEEGLEERTSGSKKKEEKDGLKRKTIASFHKPYFKAPFGQFPPENEDVKLKRVMKELPQNIQPPPAWSSDQRRILQEAIKNDALKKRLMPLMNRKELLEEKAEEIRANIGILENQLEMEDIKKENIDDDGDEKPDVKNDPTLVKVKIEKKKEALEELENKIRAIDQEMEDVKCISIVDLMSNVDMESVDWLMIANSVMDGKRTVTECQQMWKNVLHPSINKTKWTASEVEKLKELVEKYQMCNWPAVAKELDTGRTPFQCLQYYQHFLNETYNKREWTQEEDEMLQEVVENCQVGNFISWSQVSYFIDGRSPVQCSVRWNSIDPNVKRGKWAAEEDCKLITAVQLHGTKSWSTIKDYVTGRTATQCRDRYLSALDPEIKPPNAWTYEEDKTLLTIVNREMEECGRVSWVRVAALLEGRTDNSVLMRYKRLMAWKSKCEWVEKQSESDRQAMGLLSIPKGGTKTKAQKMQEAEQTSHAFKLAQLNEGVKKEDYLKQLEDKMKGEFVVPRPPLMCRYSARSFKHVWDRKKQLHDMIQIHLAREIRNATSPLKRQNLPNTTSEKFKDFVNLSNEQEESLKKLLKDKGPGEITVREILNMSRAVINSRKCIEARVKRTQEDFYYEQKMQDILLWKQYYCIYSRKRCGRPRVFQIFEPEEEDEEKTEKIKNITMSLLMNALDVDRRGALCNYRGKTDSKKREVPQEDLDFLEKAGTKEDDKTQDSCQQTQWDSDEEMETSLGNPFLGQDDGAQDKGEGQEADPQEKGQGQEKTRAAVATDHLHTDNAAQHRVKSHEAMQKKRLLSVTSDTVGDLGKKRDLNSQLGKKAKPGQVNEKTKSNQGGRSNGVTATLDCDQTESAGSSTTTVERTQDERKTQEKSLGDVTEISKTSANHKENSQEVNEIMTPTSENSQADKTEVLEKQAEITARDRLPQEYNEQSMGEQENVQNVISDEMVDVESTCTIDVNVERVRKMPGDKSSSEVRHSDKVHVGNSMTKTGNREGINLPLTTGYKPCNSKVGRQNKELTHVQKMLKSSGAGLRVIKLPPGVKVKPGMKISDILNTGTLTEGGVTMSIPATSTGASTSATSVSTSSATKSSAKNASTAVNSASAISKLTNATPAKSTSSAPATFTAAIENRRSTTATPASVATPATSGGTAKVANTATNQQTSSSVPNTCATPRYMMLRTRRSGKIKILPPCATTLQSFEGLLLHKRLLATRAKNLYRKDYYRRRSERIKRILGNQGNNPSSVKSEGAPNKDVNESGDSLLDMMDSHSASKVAAKIIEQSQPKSEVGLNWDPLSSLRRTQAYQMLTQRFRALFLWPALLSTIDPPRGIDDENRTKYITTHAKIGRRLHKMATTASKQVKIKEESENDGGKNVKGPILKVVGTRRAKVKKNAKYPISYCRTVEDGEGGKSEIVVIRNKEEETTNVPVTEVTEPVQEEKGPKYRRPRKNYKELVDSRQSGRIAEKRRYKQQVQVENEARLTIHDGEGEPVKKVRKPMVPRVHKKPKVKSTFQESTEKLKMVAYKSPTEEEMRMKSEIDIPMIPAGLAASAMVTPGFMVQNLHSGDTGNLPPGVVPMAVVVIPQDGSGSIQPEGQGQGNIVNLLNQAVILPQDGQGLATSVSMGASDVERTSVNRTICHENGTIECFPATVTNVEVDKYVGHSTVGQGGDNPASPTSRVITVLPLGESVSKNVTNGNKESEVIMIPSDRVKPLDPTPS